MGAMSNPASGQYNSYNTKDRGAGVPGPVFPHDATIRLGSGDRAPYDG